MSTPLKEPFIAVVPNAEPGGDFDRTHAVYLVNPLDAPLANVYEGIGGFVSTNDSVLKANEKWKGPWRLEARAALRLETTSQDEFDELVCWWQIRYDLDGETHNVSFSAGKRLKETTPIECCPVLGTPALIVAPE